MVQKYGLWALIPVFVLTGCRSAPAPSKQTEIWHLEPDFSVGREIPAGRSHAFEFMSSGNEYLDFGVEQCGADVAVSITDATQNNPVIVDQRKGRGGQEHILYLTGDPGRYEIEIQNCGNHDGFYLLELFERRPAARGDWSYSLAHMAELEARAWVRKKEAAATASALIRFEDSLLCFRDLGDNGAQVRVMNRLGLTHMMLGQMDAALNWFEQALSMVKHLDNPREYGKIHANTALIFLSAGEARKGLNHLLEARHWLEKVGQETPLARVSNSIGGAYQILGEFNKALVHYQYALKIFQSRQKFDQVGIVLSNIAVVYLKMGEAHKSLDFCRGALDVFQNLNEPDQEAVALINLGRAHQRLGSCDEALEFYERSLGLFEKLGAIDRIGDALDAVGSSYSCLGRTLAAEEAFQKALVYREQASDKKGTCATLHNLASVFHDVNRLELAQEHVENAWHFCQDIGDVNLESAILFTWARILRTQGAATEAERKMLAAIDALEQCGGNLPHHDLHATFLGARNDYFEFYVDLLMEQKGPNNQNDRLALEVSERFRARGLLDRVKAKQEGSASKPDKQVLDRQRFLIEEIYRREQGLLAEQTFQSEHAALGEEPDTFDLLAEYAGLASTQDHESERFKTISNPSLISISDVQEKLLDGESVLLAFALGHERSFGWVVTQDLVESYALPSREKVEALARRVCRLLKTNATGIEEARNAAIKELSQLLLGPVVSLLQKKRLVVMADGALHYVPFSVLSIEGLDGKNASDAGNVGPPPLILTHEVVSIPSLSVIQALRSEPAKSTGKKLAIFADPVFDPRDLRVVPDPKGPSREGPEIVRRVDPDGQTNVRKRPLFPRLWSSRLEAEQISKWLPEDQRFIALDFDANLTTLSKSGLDQFEIIHFATHGLLNSRNPALSGLILSLVTEDGSYRDGLLGLHRIYALNLNAQLVVLSACDTALGREIRGEGLQALTRAFMCAGSDAVVGSLWSVPDHTTAELMEGFYEAVFVQQLTPSAALRSAQLAVIEANPGVSPYHWAGFVFQGDWL